MGRQRRSEKTKAGLARVRKQGKKLGRHLATILALPILPANFHSVGRVVVANVWQPDCPHIEVLTLPLSPSPLKERGKEMGTGTGASLLKGNIQKGASPLLSTSFTNSGNFDNLL